MIASVTECTLIQAAGVHAAAWRDSHQHLCTPAYVDLHDTSHQMQYIQSEISRGKRFFLLTLHDMPIGVVSVCGDQIADLYVLPEHQGKGYGTKLLRFAMSQCTTPRLWILSNNEAARQLYLKHGFRPTGAEHPLSETLLEQEMACIAC